MAASGGLDVPGKIGRMAAGKAEEEEEEEEEEEKIRRKGFGSESQTRMRGASGPEVLCSRVPSVRM